jgi:hypothetical protein
MSVVESVAAVVTALGGLGGGAALVNAISARKNEKEPNGVIPPKTARPGVGNVVRWCLALGIGACLLAGTLVLIVGTTTLALDRLPIALLEWGVVAVAALAIYLGAGSLRRGVRERLPDLMLYAGAGLVAAFGALATTLIAGTG